MWQAKHLQQQLQQRERQALGGPLGAGDDGEPPRRRGRCLSAPCDGEPHRWHVPGQQALSRSACEDLIVC